MKLSKYIASGLALGVIVFAVACKKETKFGSVITEQFPSNAKAQIKVINAANNTQRNYVYVDGVNLSGITFADGGAFPANSYYADIYKGVHAVMIKDTLSTGPQIPVTVTADYLPQRKYTIFMYDSTKNLKTKLVEDKIVVPADTGFAMIRFANFAYSTTPIPNLDVYSYSKKDRIWTNISPTTVSDFIRYNATTVVDTFYFRPTGTNVDLIKLAFTLTQKRSYSIVFRGRYSATRTVSVYAQY